MYVLYTTYRTIDGEACRVDARRQRATAQRAEREAEAEDSQNNLIGGSLDSPAPAPLSQTMPYR